MLIVIGCTDRHLSANLGRIVALLGLLCVRTNKIERVTNELKTPERFVIVDASWKELQIPGVLKRLVNIGNISGNKLICICPNRDEKLKKLARSVQPAKVFIRYDLEAAFKKYLAELFL